MTQELTASDFAAVPWGGRAIPPEGRKGEMAVRVPSHPSDSRPWAVRTDSGYCEDISDDEISAEGWTLPAPADPWDAVPDMLQAMWDTGEVRDGQVGEWYVYRYEDGSFVVSQLEAPIAANPAFRFRPRPRPSSSWQDAKVVEASTADIEERRLFMRDEDGSWWRLGVCFHSADLIDPAPMTIQKEEER